jgi:hypothetical protein
MEKIKNVFLVEISLSLLIIFTLSNYIIFIWRNSVGYYFLIICVGFLGGVIIADVGKGLISILTIYVISCITFVFLNLLPLIIFGATSEEIDIVIYVTTTELARQTLITLPILVFTCIYGCFLGKSFKEQQ